MPEGTHNGEENDMASTTRCKFRCASLIDHGHSIVVNLSAVHAPDDPESENGQFWNATPSGQISLWINNRAGAAIFEQGKDYYVDFVQA